MTPGSRCVVTDHALLRWLERVCDFPIETYRAHLAEHLEPIAASGATRFDALEGTYVFRRGVLVTVLPPNASTGIDSRERHQGRKLGVPA